MYLDYWRLQEEPFTNSLDERFFFKTSQHDEAIARMLYAVRQRKNGTILTGGYGSGKSLVRRIFLRQLAQLGTFVVAQVDNPLSSPDGMLQDIALQLGRHGDAPFSVSGEAYRAIETVLRQRNQAGVHGIVIVEEAQLLSDVARLEQLRLLMNLVGEQGRPLLTLIMIGAKEFMQHVAQSPSLQQRVSSCWALEPLSPEQLRDYVNHRLRVAGGNGWIFDDSAINTLFDYSGGTPRRVNQAADLALYLGMSESAVRVDSEMVQRVIADLERTTAIWSSEAT